MKQTALPLDDETTLPLIALEAQQEQQLIELMAQAIAAAVRLDQGAPNEVS